MKVPYEWLTEYVDCPVPPQELAAALTSAGLAVDAIGVPDVGFTGVIAGRLLTLRAHPYADCWLVASVDIGRGDPITVVTGAPGLSAGDVVPVALPGAVLPGGVRVTASAFRGVDSAGMLCSAAELGLAGTPEAAAAVLCLDAGQPGQDVASLLGSTGAVLELDLTPNRGDCLSILGVAREVAAIYGTELAWAEPRAPGEGRPAASYTEVVIEAADLCPRYSCRILTSIRIGASPDWMQRRLLAAGLRPISNVVDTANYVMLELGQPLHAFDYDKLRGGIRVRRAGRGEQLRTLDGQLRVLAEDDLVIADDSGAIALAGVMGGRDSEVTAATRTILLESAVFDPVGVRRTSRRLGLVSEASQRFVRRVDPEGTVRALDRAAELLQRQGACIPAPGVVEAVARAAAPRVIRLRTARANALLGLALSTGRMAEILTSLGLKVTGTGDGLEVIVPPRRPDLEEEVDLVEEVGRLHGYDQVPATMPKARVGAAALSPSRASARALRELLTACGLREIVTSAFVSPAAFDRALVPVGVGERHAIALANPLSQERSLMRTLLFPSMLETLEYNVARQTEDLALFELGPVYIPQALPLTELPAERQTLACGACGRPGGHSWHGRQPEAGFYWLKGVIEALAGRLGLGELTFVAAGRPWLRPGRAAEIQHRGATIGWLGEAHPDLLKAYRLPAPVSLVELEASVLMESTKTPAYRPLPRYPASSRDLAVVVSAAIPADAVLATARRAGGGLLAAAELFDVYAGPHVPQGHRSLAIACTYQAEDRTLTDAEVEVAHTAVTAALTASFGAKVRG